MRGRVTTGLLLVVALLALVGCSSGPDGSSGAADGGAAPGATSAGPSGADHGPATSFDAEALEPYLTQELDWRPCGALECADLVVPVRYDRPDGRTLRVALARHAAEGPGEPVGTLVMNPGGPGGSGVDYVRAAGAVTSDRLRAGFDLVGVDPRGVHGSRPAVECVTDDELDAVVTADASPDDPVELDELVRVSRRFGEGCAERSPDLYRHVGTRDAALDLEVLRAALGEERLHFLGKSYGTLLGITYAETFPDRVGRMVLDGVLDPALGADEMLAGQAAGFEVAFRAFLDDCVRRDDCAFSDAEDGYRRTLAWLDRLDARPLVDDDGRELNQPLAQLAIVAGLYDDRHRWSTLRTALRTGLDGSPTATLALADAAVDRRSDGTYRTNATDAQYAVTCLDREYVASVDEIAQRAERLAADHPVFGSYVAWGDLPCSLWPAEPTRLAHRVAADLPPVLVVGTTRDPATPMSWARSLADQLGDATLLRWDADGHTAYGRGSPCVDDFVDDFLVDGTLPGADPTCHGR